MSCGRSSTPPNCRPALPKKPFRPAVGKLLILEAWYLRLSMPTSDVSKQLTQTRFSSDALLSDFPQRRLHGAACAADAAREVNGAVVTRRHYDRLPLG